MLLVHARGLVVRAGLGYIFSIFISLASRGVMGKLGSIVVLPRYGDGIVVSRLMGAPLGERPVTDVFHGPGTALTCCGWWGSLILPFRLVEALWPSSTCFLPRLPHLCGVLCCS